MAKKKPVGSQQRSLLEFTETIVDLPAAGQLDVDYFAYAEQVIEDRAIPSAADGLKPVHRRILWDMHVQRLFSDRPFVKVARVVGDVMALFHPHGDQSISDALARMAQPFSNLVPLLDFHGNYGSPDFSAAAPRYTETRLGPMGMLLLEGIDQGVVPMVENYEGSTFEPVVLPALFPHALVNGSNGIAVGLSSYLPPHDPGEVIEATLHLLANPKATVDELMTFIIGPSFPNESTVTNGDELIDIYRAGTGRVVVRGAWTVEDLGRGRQQLVITSLPYADTTTGSCEKFVTLTAEAIDRGDLAGIVQFNDESSDGKTRITMVLAAGIQADQVIPALLKFTNLQVSNKVQMHFLDDDGRVRLFNLRTLLVAWINHRVKVITRRSENRIAKIDERLHRLRGFLLVLLDIDRAIAIIRTSKTRAVARASLMEAFGVDEVQANAVLDLTLGQLTEDARIEFSREAEELDKEHKRLSRLLASPALLRRQVGIELEEVLPKFEHVRRVTTITTEAAQKVSKSAFVLDEPTTVSIDANGYLQAQRAAGRGKALKLTPVRSFDTSTSQNLVIITASGRLHRALVAGVPTDKPTAAVNVFAGMEPADRVLGWWVDETLPAMLITVSSDGSIKRIAADDLAGGDRKGGITIVKLDEGASLLAVLDGLEEVVLLMSALGQAIRFGTEEIPVQGRAAGGVRGLKLAPGDSLVGAVGAADGGQLFVVHTSGMVKRVAFEDFAVQGRAGKGVRGSVTGGRFGSVLFATVWQSGMLVHSSDGPLELDTKTVPLAARDSAPSRVKALPATISGLI